MLNTQAYRSTQTRDWTRIDMLLRLYEASVASLQSLQVAIESHDYLRAGQHHLRSMNLLVGILEGVDPEQSEISQQIHRLCLYMIDEVSHHSADGVSNALLVLQTLHDGFRQIRDEAAELESMGLIPPLASTRDMTLATG